MSRYHIVLYLLASFFLAVLTGGMDTKSQGRFMDKPLPGPYGTIDYVHSAAVDGTVQQAVPQAPTANWASIAFQSNRNGNWEIYLTPDFGTTVTRLTSNSTVDSEPHLNKDASRIVFTSNRNGKYDIYAMNVDGTALTRLTTFSGDDVSPAWSNDSTRIAYSSNTSSNWEIAVMNSDGSGKVQLTTSPGIDDLYPAWSPDGSQIAWTRYDSTGGALWVMNSDGSSPHAITGYLPYIQYPSWSPDGSLIAFDGDGDNDGWNELFVITPSGTNRTAVYDSVSSLVDSWMGGWTPDSMSLIFSRVEYVVSGNNLVINRTRVERVDKTGGNWSRILNTGYDLHPDLQSSERQPPALEFDPMPQYRKDGWFTFTWNDWDFGPAGVTRQQLEIRDGETGSWLTLYDRFMPDHIAMYDRGATPGHTIYFRGRAVDAAGNIGAWSSHTIKTTFYTSLLSGRVLDNRNISLPGVTVDISPAPIDLANTGVSSSFTTHLNAVGSHQVVPAVPGYSPLIKFPIDIRADTLLNMSSFPIDDILYNGDFEDQTGGVKGWAIDSVLPVSPTVVNRLTGYQAVSLGQVCPFSPCLTSPIPFPFQRVSQLRSDHDGNLHAFLLSGGFGVYYSYHPKGGQWTTPEVVPDSIISEPVGYEAMAIDQNNTVYVVWGWVHSAGSGLYFSQRSAAGAWSSALYLGTGDSASLAVDSMGNLHLGYRVSDTADFYYRKRTSDGTWLSPVLVWGYCHWGSDLAVSPDGTVHLTWSNADNYTTMYQSISPAGVWSNAETIAGLGSALQRIVVDPGNNIHLFARGVHIGNYIYRPNVGQWSSIDQFPEAAGGAALVTGNDSTVYMITGTYIYPIEGAYFLVRKPGQPWTQPLKLGIEGQLIAIDPEDHVYLADSSFYQTDKPPAPNTVASMSQAVTIPPAMNKPTLSFDYLLKGPDPWANSGFSIGVTSHSVMTDVFSTTLPTDWKTSWMDLSPWSGQTVTITLSLHQAANEAYVNLLLDDLHLGSWLTPVIEQVSPQVVPYGVSETLILHGENFLQGASYRIDEMGSQVAQWVDGRTISVPLDAGLSPGTHYLWITNPNGPANVIQFIIGQQSFIPIVTR